MLVMMVAVNQWREYSAEIVMLLLLVLGDCHGRLLIATLVIVVIVTL